MSAEQQYESDWPEPTNGCAPRGAPNSAGDPERNEDDIDDQFRSLLEGLRTSLPGVQVLFAFLLTAPFQGRFADLDSIGRAAFAVAFYAAGLASILLISPSVHQRLRAPATGLPRRSKSHLVMATWITVVGTIVMGVAVVATVFLVSKVVFSDGAAAAATAAVAAAVLWGWFYVPLVTFRRPA